MTGNINPVVNSIQPCLYPITSLVGASFNYASQLSGTFALGSQVIGQILNRSNATTAMTDSLPNPAISIGDQTALPNGWNVGVFNTDASAAITLTPVSPVTINGASSLSITAGKKTFIY